jgi:transporter family-2 protein
VSGGGIAVVVSLLAGVAGSVQVAVNGVLGRRIGVLEATAFGSLVAAAIVLFALLVARRGLGFAGAALAQPPWLWIGGAMGALIVVSITYAPTHIGTFATVGLLLAGQLATAAAIDQFGLFGLARIPLTATRTVGLVLLAAGAVLVLRR